MVVSCCAYGCTNRQNNERKLQFHSFPHNNPVLFKKWIIAVRRASWQPSNFSRICGIHFTPDSYKSDSRRYLKDDAVPTIFNFEGGSKKGKRQPKHILSKSQTYMGGTMESLTMENKTDIDALKSSSKMLMLPRRDLKHKQSAKLSASSNKTFVNIQSYYKRVRSVDHEEIVRSIKCFKCNSLFSCRYLCLKHIEQSHFETIETKEFYFNTNAEFALWKESMEKETISYYKKKKSNLALGGKIETYVCNRNGSCAKHFLVIRKRRSIKYDFYCPARIVKECVSEPKKGIMVIFTSTHFCNLRKARISAESDENNHKSEINMSQSLGENSDNKQEMTQNVLETEMSQITSIDFCHQTKTQNISDSNDSNHTSKINVDSFKKNILQKQLQEEAKAAVIGFLPEIDNLQLEKTLKEIIFTMNMLKKNIKDKSNSEKNSSSVEINKQHDKFNPLILHPFKR